LLFLLSSPVLPFWFSFRFFLSFFPSHLASALAPDALHLIRPDQGAGGAPAGAGCREAPAKRAMTGTRARMRRPASERRTLASRRSTVAISASANALPHAAFPSGSRRLPSPSRSASGGGLGRSAFCTGHR
jgi:hypothetical protein